MEKYYEIKTKDNHIIYGVLNYKKQTNKLIILVNGLGGTKELHLPYNSAQFFPKHGFNTFRFDFFSDNKKGRLLSKCSISTFTSDLNSIIDYFKNKYEKIYLIGHSLGGCIVINSNHNDIEKLILWDGTIFPKNKESEKFNKKRFTYNESLNKYIINTKIEYLLSKEMIEEREKQDESIISKIKKPIKLIMAENFFLKDQWKNYLDLIQTKYEFVIIKNATHGFDEEGTEEKLFSETLNFLNKN